MSKKLLAILFAALMVITVMAGCQRTEIVYPSDWSDANEGPAGENNGDVVQVTDDNGAVMTNADGGIRTVIRTNNRTTRVRTKKNGKTQAGKPSRSSRPLAQQMKYKPIPDPGADYKVKGTVSIAVDTARVTDFEAMFDVMEQLFPNIDIKYDYWAHQSWDNANEYLSTRFRTGNVADIVWDEAGPVVDYASKGWLYPLNDLIRKDPDAKYIPSNVRQDYTISGYLYALSHQVTFNVVVFNMNLLKQSGEKLPGMSWTFDDYERYLRAASTQLWPKGLGLGIENLYETMHLYAAYEGQQKGLKAGRSGIVYTDRTLHYDLLRDGCLFVQRMRYGMGQGIDGHSERYRITGGKSSLQTQLGAGDHVGLFAGGKALMIDSVTSWTDNYDNYDFKWEMVPAPNKGRVYSAFDQSFITSKCSKKNLPAAWQLLRFMTYSSNGNIARLSMYKPENKKLYNPKMRLYYPVTTNPAVVKVLKALPSFTKTDAYLFDHMGSSVRYGAYTVVPDYYNLMSTSGVNKAMNNITDNKDKGEGMREPVEKMNKELKSLFDNANKKAKEFGQKYGAKPN